LSAAFARAPGDERASAPMCGWLSQGTSSVTDH
jgi:hypothetical protein